MKATRSYGCSCVVAAIAALLLTSGPALAEVLSSQTLSNVPAYRWYHGCTPTAAASVLGYYDVLGYENLFDASGWDAVKLMGNVKDHISSPAHNAKYDSTPDVADAVLPPPPFTSLADWMRTSVDPYAYGDTSRTYCDDGLREYAAYRGYAGATARNLTYGVSFGWTDLVSEIDNGRPLLLLVDSDGDGSSDHAVPVFGYEDRGSEGKYYACYITRDYASAEEETPTWYEFRGAGNVFGVTHATTFAIPEPSTMAILVVAACALLLVRGRECSWRRG